MKNILQIKISVHIEKYMHQCGIITYRHRCGMKRYAHHCTILCCCKLKNPNLPYVLFCSKSHVLLNQNLLAIIISPKLKKYTCP